MAPNVYSVQKLPNPLYLFFVYHSHFSEDLKHTSLVVMFICVSLPIDKWTVIVLTGTAVKHAPNKTNIDTVFCLLFLFFFTLSLSFSKHTHVRKRVCARTRAYVYAGVHVYISYTLENVSEMNTTVVVHKKNSM